VHALQLRVSPLLLLLLLLPSLLLLAAAVSWGAAEGLRQGTSTENDS
jgi:hypothetical protein